MDTKAGIGDGNCGTSATFVPRERSAALTRWIREACDCLLAPLCDLLDLNRFRE